LNDAQERKVVATTRNVDEDEWPCADGESFMTRFNPLIACCLATILLAPAVACADDAADLESVLKELKASDKAGKLKETAALHERVIELSVKVNGENHTRTAAFIHNFAFFLGKQRKFAQAAAFYERSLAIKEKILGPDDVSVALTLNNLGNAFRELNRCEKAEPLLRRSLAIRQAKLGKEHIEVAKTLSILGKTCQAQVKLAEAQACLERSLAIREKVEGKDSVETANTLDDLAKVCLEQRNYATAEPLFVRALALREKKYGPEHESVAGALHNLTNLYMRQARLDDAERAIKRCLAIREKLFGADSLEAASSINSLGIIRGAQARQLEAETLYLRCLAIREKQLGKEDPAVGKVLNNLASVQAELGKPVEAEASYRRSLAISEKAHGPDHQGVLDPLHNLANFTAGQGKLAAAEALFLRALSILERAYGKEHPALADTLNDLAILYDSLGRFAEAEALCRRGLSLREKALGPDHPEMANSFITLANIYQSCAKLAEAVPLYLRALRIIEQALGKDHPRAALVLNQLANVYSMQERWADAEKLYERAIIIEEKTRGKDHPATARPLANLAKAYRSQQKYEAAQPLYLRALAIFEKANGSDDISTIRALHNLSGLYTCQHCDAEAAPWETRFRQSMRRFLLRELPNLSASEQHDYLSVHEKAYYQGSLSLGLRGRNNPAIAAASAEWLLNGKAISLEAQTIRGRLEREITDVEGKRLLAEIQSIRAQEAGLALSARAEGLAEQRQQLQSRRRDIEKKLAERSSAAAKVANNWVELAEVRKGVPPGGVLIDIARFRVNQFNAKTTVGVYTAPRYVAWVVPALGAGEPRLVDLGLASKVDAAISDARTALENTPDRLEKGDSEKKLEAETTEKLAAVAKLVFEPLKPHLGTAKQLILSPDGDLWLLPWAALPDGKGGYLIDEHSLRFVVTGRDLIQQKSIGKRETTPALILADPDYNSTPGDVALAARQLGAKPEDATASLTRSAGDDLRGVGRVKRLPGTAAEAKQAFEKLKTLTGQAPKLYQQVEASETIVKSARSPEVLVLATHGFFLKTQEAELPEGEVPGLDLGNGKKPAEK
jgi:tetratricopeptide (TPR) repeat protein